MKSQKILILGGCGYIGSVLCPFLYDAGYDITVVDLCWFGNYLDEKIPLIKKDIFDLKKKDLEDYESIIFLAGLSNDPMAEFSPKDNFIYNTAMPSYIAFIAKEAGVKKMIFASSCSVYGYTHNRTFCETDIAMSNYPYGVSKLQGEQALLALADENFSVICFRQGTVCGYSPRMRLDLAINTMFKNAIQNHEIKLSNSKIWRPILGLEDLCSAYLKGLEIESNQKNIYNISSFNITIGELANDVSIFLNNKERIQTIIYDSLTQDYRNYKVSTQLIENCLGFHALQNLDNILNDLYIHLPLFQPFDNKEFYNIEIFKQITLNNSTLSVHE